MRDPKRIQEFCNRLAEIWTVECPDWRFGQLVCNVLDGCDIFYLEEDKMLKKFADYFEKTNKKE